MKDLIGFYKWGMDPLQESCFVFMFFLLLTSSVIVVWIFLTIAAMVSEYPLIASFIFFGPIFIAVRLLFKKYKAEQEAETP